MSSGAARTTPARRLGGGSELEPDRMLGLTRAGLAVLFALAIANGAFLFFAPSRAEPDYAWAITPPVSAAFIGAGYLAGAVATGLGTLVARRFGSVRALVPGFCVLGVLLTAATLIHADRFRWDYAPTWLWTAVYVSIPAVAIYLMQRQHRLAPPGAARVDAAIRPLRTAAVVLGALLIAVAVALYVAPDALLERWAWEITPLLARVYATWYALGGLALVVAGTTARRPYELPIAFATFACWSALALALPAIYPDEVDTGAPLFWLWIALHSALLAACVVAALRAAALMRATGERL